MLKPFERSPSMERSGFRYARPHLRSMVEPLTVITVLVAGAGMPAHPFLLFALQVFLFGFSILIPTPAAAGGAEALFFVLHRSLIPDHMIGPLTAWWRLMTFYVPVVVALGAWTFLAGTAQFKRLRSSQRFP